MSKCIERIPVMSISRIAIVMGNGRSLAQVKAATGADYVINGGFFDGLGRPTNHLKVDGKVLARERWKCWGYTWDTGGDTRLADIPSKGMANYITGVELLSPWIGQGDKPQHPADVGGIRGRTALALAPGELILYCTGDGTADAKAPLALQDELCRLGAETAIMLDGGGSSQCDFGGGRTIYSSSRVNNYICVWINKNEEEKPMGKKVCFDPGHGAGSVNCSPDKSYWEHEFAWDLYTRTRPHLERHGVAVQVTRRQDNKPELLDRCKVSNQWGADLFVSLHSNAVGAGVWVDNARGLMIYTSVAGEAAGRNKAARAILSRMTAAGVLVRQSALIHDKSYTVLAKTDAPAMIVEYGFHTSREDVALLKDGAYREKLAVATAKGILDYLGIAWVDEPTKEPEKPTTAPWYAEVQKWVKALGISDGSKPEDGITRAEVWTMIYNLYKAIKAGK